MVTTTVQINNKLGLHARASARFVDIASRYHANIEIENNGKKVNGKSIMGIMMLAATKGTIIKIYANGSDEEQASHALSQLVKNRFDEAE